MYKEKILEINKTIKGLKEYSKELKDQWIITTHLLKLGEEVIVTDYDCNMDWP